MLFASQFYTIYACVGCVSVLHYLVHVVCVSFSSTLFRSMSFASQFCTVEDHVVRVSVLHYLGPCCLRLSSALFRPVLFASHSTLLRHMYFASQLCNLSALFAYHAARFSCFD